MIRATRSLEERAHDMKLLEQVARRIETGSASKRAWNEFAVQTAETCRRFEADYAKDDPEHIDKAYRNALAQVRDAFRLLATSPYALPREAQGLLVNAEQYGLLRENDE